MEPSTVCLGNDVHVEACNLLEHLELQHEQAFAPHEVSAPTDPPTQLTRVIWDECLLGGSNPELASFQALYFKWSRSYEQHSACNKELMGNKDLSLRLLCYLSDLMEYKDSKEAQDRMDYVLPTATGLFESPVYFSQQEALLLNSFVSPNGQTVHQICSSKFEDRPYLQGVCTSHVLAPLLMRLFSISQELLSSKECRESRRAFNKSAADRVSQNNVIANLDKKNKQGNAAQGKKNQPAGSQAGKKGKQSGSEAAKNKNEKQAGKNKHKNK